MLHLKPLRHIFIHLALFTDIKDIRQQLNKVVTSSMASESLKFHNASFNLNHPSFIYSISFISFHL